MEQVEYLNQNTICPVCLALIDPEVCWCGEYMATHDSEHFAVEMGCICYFSTDFEEQRIER